MPPSATRSDFASAAMVRVLAEGMRQQGLALPPGLHAPRGATARIGLSLKRALISSAIEQGGHACLPLLGQGLRQHRDDPTHQALANARSGGDLLQRWARLERYVHSRHRIVVEQWEEDAAGGQARLRHEARQGPAPLAAESLVVLGVLAALLQELGLREVSATLGEIQVLPLPDGPGLNAHIGAGRVAGWTLTWLGSATARLLPPHGMESDALADTPQAAMLAGLDRPGPTWEAARRLAQDLAQPPGLPMLAADLQTSTRTLQRSLADAGFSYSALVARLRCRAGAWWLIHQPLPVAEVGFICGYADQPHFCRDFAGRVGLPPGAFRRAFGRR